MHQISGHTRLLGVMANPIKHSYSPFIHNLSLQSLGIDAVYLAFEVDSCDLPSAISSVKSLNMIGINVSMPYKQAVMPHLDQITDSANVIGAVNTITNVDGKLIGDNTDGIGFCRSLEYEGVCLKNKKLILLGAGGAARAIMHQVCLEGIEGLIVFKRKNESYKMICKYAEELRRHYECEIQVYDYAGSELLKECLKEADIIVNATNIGMKKNEEVLPVPSLEMLNASQTIVDLIYSPTETFFLKKSKEKGCHVINGLGMLVFQAAESFEKWTGKKMPIDTIFNELKSQM